MWRGFEPYEWALGINWMWWIAGAIFLVLLFMLMRRVSRWASEQRPEQSPLESLRRRYEAGDITIEEFRARESLITNRR